jgi:phosphate-selective porin
MKKTFLSALALSLFVTAAAQAQTTPTTVTKDGGDKVITTVDGMTVKTKVADDGKMKVKGYDDAGNRMKSTTKPRTKSEREDYKESRMKTRKMHGSKMKMDSSTPGSM